MTSPIAISIEGISKKFSLPHERRFTLKEHAVNIFRRNTYEEFYALRNVSLQIKKGEFLGVIGRNGSGKSTLLKILAGIYEPSVGHVHRSGDISPFLELGIGFNPELTARENVYMNGIVLGLNRKEIDQRLPSIIEFSELDRFMDQKLKNFSSGMQVRLAFSVAIQVPAEILLVDEVLAVGDADFQQKCTNIFRDFKKQKRTIVFVTHGLGQVEEFCDRAILMEQGEILAEGVPANVIGAYQLLSAGHSLRSIKEQAEKKEVVQEIVQKKSTRWGTGDLLIDHVIFLNKDGVETDMFKTGDTMRIRIHYAARKRMDRPVLGIAFNRQDGLHLSGPNTKTSNFFIESLEGKGTMDFVVKEMPFLAGQYDFTVAFYDWDCTTPYDHLEKAYHFTVLQNEKNQYGCIKLNLEWEEPVPL